MKVSNIVNNKGNIVKNQFRIENGTTVAFQSYETIIAEIHFGSAFIRFDKYAFDYSNTTSRHLVNFLNNELNKNYSAKDYRKMIKDGKIENAMFSTDFDIQISNLNG